VNGDNKIDDLDQRLLAMDMGTQPNINFGFSIAPIIKASISMPIFSGPRVIPGTRTGNKRWAFQNNGNLNAIFTTGGTARIFTI